MTLFFRHSQKEFFGVSHKFHTTILIHIFTVVPFEIRKAWKATALAERVVLPSKVKTDDSFIRSKSLLMAINGDGQRSGRQIKSGLNVEIFTRRCSDR